MGATNTEVVARLSVRDRPAFQRDMQATQGDIQGVGVASESASSRGVSAMTALAAGVAAVGATAVAVGTALLEVGGQFDNAWDTIRVGTGATGGALAVLQNDVRAVRQTTVGELGDVASTVAGLNTYLGLAGEPLQGLTSQLLNVSRLTGGDLAANVQGAARLFGDWGIGADGMEGSLDAVFRASQATGIEFSTLQEKMVTSGVTLRELGFGFTESAALLGNFEKQGVNADQVLGAMRQGLGRLARAGEDPAEAFSRIIGEIQTMDEALGRQTALELFGAKAGAEMFATIRDGRFDVGALVETVANGSETIAGLTAETADWTDTWAILKQKGFDALEPIATRVFTKFGEFLTWVGREAPPFIDMLRSKWEEAWPRISAALQTAWGYIEPVLQWLGEAAVWLFEFVLKPAYAFWVEEMWPRIQTTIQDAWPHIQTAFTAIGDHLTYLWHEVFTPAYRFWVEEMWPRIQTAIETVWPILVETFGNIGGKVAELQATWTEFRDTVVGAWDRIQTKAEQVWGWIQTHVIDPMTTAFDTVRGTLDAINPFGGGTLADTLAPSTGPPSSAAAAAAVAAPQVTQISRSTTTTNSPQLVYAPVVHAIDDEGVRRFFANNRQVLLEQWAIAGGQRAVTG